MEILLTFYFLLTRHEVGDTLSIAGKLEIRMQPNGMLTMPRAVSADPSGTWRHLQVVAAAVWISALLHQI